MRHAGCNRDYATRVDVTRARGERYGRPTSVAREERERGSRPHVRRVWSRVHRRSNEAVARSAAVGRPGARVTHACVRPDRPVRRCRTCPRAPPARKCGRGHQRYHPPENRHATLCRSDVDRASRIVQPGGADGRTFRMRRIRVSGDWAVVRTSAIGTYRSRPDSTTRRSMGKRWNRKGGRTKGSRTKQRATSAASRSTLRNPSVLPPFVSPSLSERTDRAGAAREDGLSEPSRRPEVPSARRGGG